MIRTSKCLVVAAAKSRANKPLSRPDQLTVSGLPGDIHDRIRAFVNGRTVKKSDVSRNALIAGVRQFEADGYEVVPEARIVRKTP